MGKLCRSVTFGVVGITGGITGLSAAAGGCAGGACAACFRCAAMGGILVAVALWNKRKGGTSDDMA